MFGLFSRVTATLNFQKFKVALSNPDISLNFVETFIFACSLLQELQEKRSWDLVIAVSNKSLNKPCFVATSLLEK